MSQKVLNENTRNVLSQLTEINKICVIDYPITSFKSESGTVYAFFSTKDMGEDEFDTFGIFNVQELLQVINLDEDTSTTLDNNIINITGKNSSIKYTTTDLGILGDYTKIKPTVLQKTKAVDTVLEFELSSENFTQIKKASDVFKNLEDLIISNTGESITVEVGESNKKIKNSNSYKLKLNGTSTKDNEVSINVKNLKMIPNGNYVVQVKYNKDKDAYRILMTSKDIDSLEFIIAIQS